MDLVQVFMPYCLRKLKSGYWIFLNRMYKPLGIDSDDYIDYDKSPTLFKFDKDPSKLLESITEKVISEDGEISYFFYKG